MTTRVPGLALLLLAGLATAAAAQKPAKKHHGASHDSPTVQASVSVTVFSDRERSTIKSWYAEHPVRARPLPPGIAKNLARGKPLPPGIAKQQIPSGLTERMPERRGQDILVIGDRIVILDPAGLVVDILHDIL
ncbi:MAG TPA: anti-virulence regulator CigR family protein [Gemmatimonadales bacterium]|nr:anti-virulence regulator CigR family protein [Gemmatimonadales bacterium]